MTNRNCSHFPGYMGIFVSFCFLLLFCGCGTEIGVTENSAEQRLNYGNSGTEQALHIQTGNLLSNYQLNEVYETDPDSLVVHLEKLYRLNQDTAVIAALADASFQIGMRDQDPEKSSPFYLAAAVYSCLYLKHADHKGLYDEQRIHMIRVYNLASTELFFYLKNQKLERSSDFTLTLPGSKRNVTFTAPVYNLPLDEKNIRDFTPCSNYTTHNLTHNTRIFGAGVPIIATLNENCRDSLGIALPGIPIAVSLVMDFQYDLNTQETSGTLHYVYSRTQDQIIIGGKTFPLASDFSTPLAKAADLPAPIHFLRRTLKVEEASAFTGLYLFEPYDDQRIPVVFVHGLMSDMRTWGQMLNTLLHDQKIRQKYQFLGFSYSSGNPVFLSGKILRESLQDLRKKLIQAGKSTEQFDQMVLIGHSMGGLLSRLQISSCSPEHAAEALGIPNLEQLKKECSVREQAEIGKIVNFTPDPFVKRVIFIAVPHRGSEIARSWIGALGAAFIELPLELVSRNVQVLEKLVTTGSFKDGWGKNTGIDNLRPDAPSIRLLNSLKMDPSIPCHSIMGHQESAFLPGGTDGIVPYWSSHLEHAQSELVVKSGHSAHRSPLAIQEVRQILLLHAGYPGKHITGQND